MFRGLKGHQLSGARRLNGHYQSAKTIKNSVSMNSYFIYSDNYFTHNPIIYNPNTSSTNVFKKKYNPKRDTLRITIEPSINVLAYNPSASYPNLGLLYKNSGVAPNIVRSGYNTQADIINGNYPNDSLTLSGYSNNATDGIPLTINISSEFTQTANNGRIITIKSNDANANFEMPFDALNDIFFFYFNYEIDPSDVPSISHIYDYPIKVTVETF